MRERAMTPGVVLIDVAIVLLIFATLFLFGPPALPADSSGTSDRIAVLNRDRGALPAQTEPGDGLVTAAHGSAGQ